MEETHLLMEKLMRKMGSQQDEEEVKGGGRKRRRNRKVMARTRMERKMGRLRQLRTHKQ